MASLIIDILHVYMYSLLTPFSTVCAEKCLWLTTWD